MFGFNSSRYKRKDFKFCENQKVIKRFLEELEPHQTQDDNSNCDTYVDAAGQLWEVYEHDDCETYREPYLKGVRKYPHPEFDEVISTVCESKYEDEVEGACRLLLENELLGIEFRERLLDKIEENNI
jgi:hypothetical protein